ncbi:MAG TPA: HEAT repeat domain-containing protein [Candidatus Ozemobacteraceae bacterium]|nr:HEAT repeat domain-containing protein [Candidatus Ozemobacteraceae bacterium]
MTRQHEARRYAGILERLSSRDRAEKLLAIQALGILRVSEHADQLVDLLASPDEEIVGAVLESLGRIANPRSVKYVLEFVGAPKASLADRALNALAGFELTPVLDLILKAADTEKPPLLRRRLLTLVSHIRDPRVASVMTEIIGQTQDPGLLVEACMYFVRFPSTERHTLLKMLGNNGQWEVAMSAQLALSRLGDEGARGHLKRLAKSPAHPIRLALVQGLARRPMIEDRELYEIFSHDPHPQVRLVAIQGLSLFKTDERARILAEWLGRERDETVLPALLHRAAAEKHHGLYPEFFKLLTSGNPGFKALAVEALVGMGESIVDRIVKAFPKLPMAAREQLLIVAGGIGGATAKRLVEEHLRDRERWVRINAMEALARLGARDALPLLMEMADAEKDPWARASLISVLSRLGGPEQVPVCEAGLTSPDARVRANAIEGLLRLGVRDRDWQKRIEPLLRDPNDRVRVNAAIVLSKMGDQTVMPTLIAMTREATKWLRASAAFALGEIADREGVPALLTLLDDKEDVVYRNALQALGKIADIRSLIPILQERSKDRLPGEFFDELLAGFHADTPRT